MAQPAVDTNIVTITPEMAEEWLKKNPNNRKLNRGRAIDYAEVLKRGEWELNGESIIFDEAGNLMDGQHRLLAVQISGIPMKAVVVNGVNRESMPTLNTGRRRSLGDNLRIMGVNLPTKTAAMLRWRFKIDQGPVWIRGSMYPTHPQALALLEELGGTVTHSMSIVYSRPNERLLGMMGPLTALHSIVYGRYRDRADAFFQQLTTGANMSAESPAFLLRDRLIREKMKRERVEEWVRLAYAVKAWNAFIDRKPIRVLRLHKDEKFPDIIGGPDWGTKTR